MVLTWLRHIRHWVGRSLHDSHIHSLGVVSCRKMISSFRQGTPLGKWVPALAIAVRGFMSE
jgi:hypothetical protein